MKISPALAAKIAATLSVLLLIGGGSIALPLGIPHDVADKIQSYCLFIGLIAGAWGTASGLWSAPVPGPLAPPVSRDEVRKLADDAQMTVVPKQPAAASVAAGGKQ